MEILIAGELLVDLISTDYADDFRAASTYARYPGGSPANLAANLARLGHAPALAATVGDDAAGQLLYDWAASAGIDTPSLRRAAATPTTLILVTKSRTVSEFEAYRAADRLIEPTQLPTKGCRLLHTTAFALSREPARGNILAAARAVARGGGALSIDINYAQKIWPDRSAARNVLAEYLERATTALVKASEVDYARLLGEEVTEPAAGVARLRKVLRCPHATVCLTLGAQGAYVAPGIDAPPFALPARPVEVRDTTGAGDAFWGGFLAGYLEGRDWQTCAHAGRGLAERKLTTVGPLTERFNLHDLIT